MAQGRSKKSFLFRNQGLKELLIDKEEKLKFWAGFLLILLLSSLPFLARVGFGIMMVLVGLIWIVWLRLSPPKKIGETDSWIFIFLVLSLLSVCFSPVPFLASKGLIKLLAYLIIYSLFRKLFHLESRWWDRLLAALLFGEIFACVVGLRQIYGPLQQISSWSDQAFLSEGAFRIYGSFGNPNLFAGYLVPVLPLSIVAIFRWTGVGGKLFAFVSFILGIFSIIFTYSRGGWLGSFAALFVFLAGLFLCRPIAFTLNNKRILSILFVFIVATSLVFLHHYIEPIKFRLLSIIAGRDDSSNNFRINVWSVVIEMIRDRPLLGIGPGNSAFISVYTSYQKATFNALSAYSVPLEILVENGFLGFYAILQIVTSAFKECLNKMAFSSWALPCLGALSSIVGLIVMGFTDTVFYRPAVQIVAFFCLATFSLNLPDSVETKE